MRIFPFNCQADDNDDFSKEIINCSVNVQSDSPNSLNPLKKNSLNPIQTGTGGGGGEGGFGGPTLVTLYPLMVWLPNIYRMM